MNISDSLKVKGTKSTLFKYATPAILSMWIFSLYTTIDGIFVGRGVGEQALAAVSLSTPFINITFALSIMTSIGASTTISNLLGKNKLKEARETFTLTIIFLAIVGFLICSLGTFFIDDVALILGAKGDMIPLVKEYLGTILIFNTFYLIAYALEILIKVEGKPTVAIIVVGAAALTNIFLDYLLVIVFPLGLKGAAIATGSSQLIQGITLLFFFLKKDSKLKFVRVKPSFKKITNLIKIGVPDSITESSIGFVILIFNRSLFNHYGEIGIISFTIISYINSFIIFTMIGLTQGMQPLVSYLEAKKEHVNKEQIFKLTLKGAAFLGVFSFISINLAGTSIVSMFIKDETTIKFTISALRKFSPAFFLLGFNVVISGYFTALEQTISAGTIALLRGIVFIPILILILPLFIGTEIIWTITFISEALTLIVAFSLMKMTSKKSSYSEILLKN